MTVNEVRWRLTADASGVRKGFRDASQASELLGQKTKETQRDVDQSMSKSSSSVRSFAKVVGGAFVGMKAVSFLKESVTAASDLEQTVGAVGSVFKDTSKIILAFSKTAATEVGLSQRQYQSMATVFGAQLKNMGVASSELAPKTNDLIRLGADLAAQFGGTTSDAVAALSSLLRGERDPIERYGVGINEARIKAELASKGLDKLTGSAADNAKLTATLDILWKQTADAQGTFARETDTLAHKQQVANAQLDDAKAKLGEGLIPVMGVMADTVGKTVIPVIGRLSDLFQFISPVLTGLAAALGWVLEKVTSIPAPVLAVAAAFAGFRTFGPAVLGFFSALPSTVATAMRGISAALGPIGWAITAVTAGFALFNHLLETSHPRTVTDEVKELTEALKAANGEIDQSVRSQIRKQGVENGTIALLEQMGVSTRLYIDAVSGVAGAQEEFASAIAQARAEIMGTKGPFADLLSDMKAAGISGEEMYKALDSGDWSNVVAKIDAYAEGVATTSGNTSDATAIQDRFNKAMQSAVDPVQRLAGVSQVARDKAQELAGQQAEIKKELADVAVATGGIATASEKASTATDSLGASQEDLKSSLKAAEAKLKEAESKLTDFEQASKNVADAQKAIADSTKHVLDQLDRLSGRIPTVEQAESNLNEALDDMAEKLKAGKDGVGGMSDALIDATGKIDTTTKAGRDLREQTLKVRESMVTAAAAAYSQAVASGNLAGAQDAANAAAQRAREEFVRNAMQLGLTEEKANDLAHAYGLIPGNVATTIDADNQQAMTKAQAVQQVSETINRLKTALNVDADTVPATDQVRTLIDQANASSATVTVNADTTPMRGKIRSILGWVNGLFGLVAGGPVPGFAGGGLIPGRPKNPRRDDRLASVDGRGLIAVQSGEYIVNRRAYQRHRDLVHAINTDGLQGFAAGGVPFAPAINTRANENRYATMSVDSVLLANSIAHATERALSGLRVRVDVGGHELVGIMRGVASEVVGAEGNAMIGGL